MSNYLLAHDLGTSGNKASLYSLEGNLINSVNKEYSTNYFNSTWVEQNPDDWWEAVCLATKELLQGIEKERVLAVSFSGQMMGCLCVDRNGKPLREHIIWADMRAEKEEKYLRENINPEKFYKIVGHRISSSYGLEKLMWVKNNQPEIYKETYKILNAKDYIIFRMTGEFLTDYSDASGTNALDINKLEWSEEIIDHAEISIDKLPQLVPSTYVAGEISNKIADECGLAPGTKVVVGGGDGMCASVGAGSVMEGKTYNCLGSSSWICTTSKKPVFDNEMRTFNWAHIVPGYVGPCGTMQAAGASFNWVKNEICKYEKSEAAASGKSPYELINQQIELSEVGSNALMFLPYLMGERSPRWSSDARGAFIGLKMEHKRGDILRSVIEGIAMNLKIILNILKQDIDIKEMLVIGGMAKGKIQRQILSDVFGMNILKPGNMDEATSLGAAVTAGVGIGILDGFHVVDKFIEIESVQTPIAENVEKYNRLSPMFDKAYFSLEAVYKGLANL